ncbi:hypothetical protein B0H19DRAFT_917092 [Mycena capillaripes]|nr:hypothetical protein B0H19DRAFT_917092 [Mycena capillaripes]
MTYTRVPFDADEDELVSECFLFPGSKEVLMNLPGFPRPLKNPAKPAFRLAAVRGKGMGLLSTRAIKMGDLILSERPLYVAARGLPVPVPSTFTRAQYTQFSLNMLEKYYEVSMTRMPPANKAAFMALKNSHLEDGSGPLVGIVRTNALALENLRPGVEGELGLYSAVCKDISRLNHRRNFASCSPNTAPRFNMASFSYQLYAVRDIAAGEELTYQYADVALPTAERQKALKPYDFVCACPSCQDPGSDGRREAIASFYAFSPAFIRRGATPLADNAFALVDDRYLTNVFMLIQREGLEHLPAHLEILKLLMESHISRGDAKGASAWAARLDKLHWDEGRDKEDVPALLDPKSPAYQKHPLWRMLIDKRPGHPQTMDELMKKLKALGFDD